MLFNSLCFIIFIFLFIPLYFITSGRIRLWICLLSSYIFYGWWDYRYLLLIFVLTIVNYYCGLKIINQTNLKKNPIFLLISIIISLIILCFFKYYNFFIDNINSMLFLFGFEKNVTSLNIILPVGISFYTLQAISYTIDIYNKKIQAEKSLLQFATYIAFFPQLVAGPIIRASCFIPQIKKDNCLDYNDFIKGIQLIIWGYFLKVVIADSLSMVVDVRFENPENQNSLSMLIGIIFFSFQVYADFAGYSLIAIGIARMLGFRFPMNFDRPFFSSNISKLWQRWHISLGSWLRDYLYIPLGGNKYGKLKTYRNLFITMLLCGLWHGASWNYVIWGGINGIYLSIHRFMKESINLKGFISEKFFILNIIGLFKILFTFILFSSPLIIFRANNIDDSLMIINNIFQFNEYSFSAVTQKFHVIKGFMLIIFLIIVEGMSFNQYTTKIIKNYPNIKLIWSAFILGLISLFGSFENNSFIYFQF